MGAQCTATAARPLLARPCEAANLRHTPECLCYIFYCLAHQLVLFDTRDFYKPTGVDFPGVKMCLEGTGRTAAERRLATRTTSRRSSHRSTTLSRTR